MVSFAATRQVNPPGASPLLTADQLWRGLGIKARNPRDFVPAITACRVVEEDEDKITRIVRFNDGPEVKEEVHFFPPTIAYFEMSPPAPAPPIRITNLVSYGPPPSSDLLLTFSFAPSLPHVSEDEARRMGPEELNEKVGEGVEKAIEVVRRLAREGKL
ncbi:DUF1857-domain-containing protein [Rhodotorula diobovata]|uniref:DUF1857-domain-containing protein n=1 Tax=Rhodotorula diobovata TaxID=5288 RepID=A0A5C5FX67_9BASI|nr:DUF1857-domain-containing protein [Rhodotorula diobovata]